MTVPRLPLTLAAGGYQFTRALNSGRMLIEGVEPNFVAVDPIVAAYRCRAVSRGRSASEVPT